MPNQPADQVLAALARHIIETAAIGNSVGDAIHLIDKDYQVTTVARTAGDEEFVLRRANHARQRMLESGNLLAAVMTGWSVGIDGGAVCEVYPAPGHKPEIYTMTYPRPRGIWTDPDDPESQDSIGAYKEIWSLEQLLERRKIFGD